MNVHRVGSFLLLALVAATPACSRYPFGEGAAPGIRVREDRVPGAQLRMNTVNILDKSLQDWSGPAFSRRSKIAIEGTSARRTDTGTLEAWAVIRNRTDYRLQLEGRARFYDENNVHAEGPTAWQRVFLEANSSVTYKESSTLARGIRYYAIEIREAR